MIICHFHLSLYDMNLFINEYFDNEQGQKECIVKNRLRERIEFWKRIGTNECILDTVMYGYKIILYSLPSKSINTNNKSALTERRFVKNAIRDLLDGSLITQCTHIPMLLIL